MNTKQLILAFLSPRYPAAYTEESIAKRLSVSPMHDGRCTVEEVSDALRSLHKMGLVSLEIDQLDNTAVWQVTQEGAKRWVLEGRVTV